MAMSDSSQRAGGFFRRTTRYFIFLAVALSSLFACSDSVPAPKVTPRSKLSVKRPDYPGFCNFLKYAKPEAPSLNCEQQWSKSPVVRLVGFDGVGWSELNLMLEKYSMPGLRRMLNQGAAAVLHTVTSDSGSDWTTIACGKGRQRHGILTYSETGISSFTYTADAIKVPRVWDMFSYHKVATRVSKYFFVPDGGYKTPNMEDQCRTAINDIGAGDYDFFVTFIEATDHWQHQGLMALHLKEGEWGKNFSVDHRWSQWVDEMTKTLVSIYKEMDDLIGYLLAVYPNDYLVVVSDHGMRVDDPTIRVELKFEDQWFLPNRQKKLLPPETDKASSKSQILEIEPGCLLKLEEEARLVPVAVNNRTQEEVLLKIKAPRLTLIQPDGIDPSEVELIIRELLEMTFFEARVFRKTPEGPLVMTEEMIQAYCLSVIPDYFQDSDFRLQYQIFSHESLVGRHNPEDHGIFMAYGPGIRKGVVVPALDLVDVTPTLLYLGGLPAGKDMQGSVAEPIILPEILKQRPIAYIDSYDSVIKLKAGGAERDELSEERRKAYKQSGYPGLE